MKSSYTREFNFTKYLEQVVDAETIHYLGSVVAVRGLDIESEGPRSVIGEICTIKLSDGTSILAEVVGLNEKIVKLTAFGNTKGIEVGCEVIASGATLRVPVGRNLLGKKTGVNGRRLEMVRPNTSGKDQENNPVMNDLIQKGGIYWPISSDVLERNSKLVQNAYWK